MAAVILAAGASSRMGRPKMLLPLEHDSVIRTMVQRALDAQLDPVIVVVGANEAEIRAELSSLPVQFARNSSTTGPTSESLHIGLNALPNDIDAAMVILPDMVRVTREMLSRLRGAGCDAKGPLAVSRYGDVFAPPLFFRRPLFAELLAWNGEGCGKQVVMRHRNDATVIDWPEAILADIDTPDDYQTFRSEIAHAAPPSTLNP